VDDFGHDKLPYSVFREFYQKIRMRAG
jgi:hypothetical protein